MVHPCLQIGGRVVCYSQYSELISQVFEFMLEGRKYVSVTMLDCFSRTMQVLPNRTHPLMNMNQFSGYLLWGIKVTPSFVKDSQ